MSFSNLSIKNRLYAGFGIIVVMSLSLSLFAGWQLSSIQSNVSTMARLSENALRINETIELLQDAQRATLRFTTDADEASFKEAAASETAAVELLHAAADVAKIGDRAATYQGLQKAVLEFRTKREALGELIKAKASSLDELFVGGDQLTAFTQKLVLAAHQNDEPAIVQAAANVETAVLLTRIANWRFLATHDSKGVANFETNAEKARQQIAALRKLAPPQEIVALAASVDSSLANYAAAFGKNATAAMKADELFVKEMRPLIISSVAKIKDVGIAQKQDFKASETSTETGVDRTITVQEAAAGATTLLAGLIAFFIARGISGPIKSMVTAMKKLAGGDLKVEIPAQANKDEIGDMAQAVLVFQQAAVENARLEAEAVKQRANADAARAHNEQAQRDAIEHERAIVASSIGAALAKLAAKDLTYRMPADIPDAYRKLQADFNEAIGQLEGAMQSVTGSTGAILSGSLEIASASEDLSRRTEQQAASLEETAAALDEITATVRKSAEGASHARQVVASADDDAKKSASVVRQAVEAMDAISKSSQQISQIIGVIDEIAFQTNLLALNAGVEAARAGDAGRGFAVVASEVRALAQRSAEAAKEIKGLISASTTQVNAGVKLVAETGKSLERIMAQVNDINNVMAEIATGSKEQATGLAEVNTAMNQMDQMTQQNAAMVEESTAASHSLSQETSQLSGLIGQFQVGRSNSDNAMRQQLQKVAPHAFRPPAKAPAAGGGKAAAVRPVGAAPKKMAAQGGAASTNADWEEF